MTKKTFILDTVLFSIATSLFLFSAIPGFADVNQSNALSISLYPDLIRIQEQTPAQVKTPVKIQNNADTPVTIGIKFLSFAPSQESNGSIVLKTDQKISGIEKISIESDGTAIERITLAPKQQKDLMLSLLPTADLKTQDAYVAAIFSSLPQTLPRQNKALTATSSISGGIALPILVSNSTKETKHITLDAFSTNLIQEHGPVFFQIKVGNESNYLATTQGDITIRNMFGQVIGQVNLVPTLILAHGSRFITNSTSTQLAEVVNRIPKGSLPETSWEENFILGPYTATLTLVIDGKQQIQKTTYFIGLPAELTFGLLIGVLLILLVTKRVQEEMS